MAQEEKDLLLKDLCARLPYGVKVCTSDNDGSLENVWDILWYNTFTEDVKLIHSIEDADKIIDISEVKPYLFPLSSMTEEQKEELYIVTNGKFNAGYTYIDNCKPRNWNEWGTTEYNWIRHYDIDLLHTWLNKNHFDYRGLIEKGLAIEAPEGMYN